MQEKADDTYLNNLPNWTACKHEHLYRTLVIQRKMEINLRGTSIYVHSYA